MSDRTEEVAPPTGTFEDALKVARMYYHLDMTTTRIASQLGMARPPFRGC